MANYYEYSLLPLYISEYDIKNEVKYGQYNSLDIEKYYEGYVPIKTNYGTIMCRKRVSEIQFNNINEEIKYKISRDEYREQQQRELLVNKVLNNPIAELSEEEFRFLPNYIKEQFEWSENDPGAAYGHTDYVVYTKGKSKQQIKITQMTEKQKALSDNNTVLTETQYNQLSYSEQQLFVKVQDSKQIYFNQFETINEYYKKDIVGNLLQELEQSKNLKKYYQEQLENLMSRNLNYKYDYNYPVYLTRFEENSRIVSKLEQDFNINLT
jgi:hypothetical protein